MDNKEFEEIFESMVSASRALLVEKAKEYADDGDRLHNFKAAMHAQGLKTTMQANRGMTTKHTVSINDMVWSGKDYPMEKWQEKIGDEFNYLILLMACIWETKNEQADKEDAVEASSDEAISYASVDVKTLENGTRITLGDNANLVVVEGQAYPVFDTEDEAKAAYPGCKFDVQPINWLSRNQSFFIGNTHYHKEKR